MPDLLTILDTADSSAQGVFEEKRSRFIANACHIGALEEAAEFVERTRLTHPKARHVAFAALHIDDNNVAAERMSDDGEPAGTAGKPILELLRHRSLGDCVITVTRYFGGILLGAGALTRAYAKAASLALDTACYGKIIVCTRFSFDIAYDQLNACKRCIMVHDGKLADARYTDSVDMVVDVPQRSAEQFRTSIIDELHGSVHINILGTQRNTVAVANQ